ncbi:YebC/PmpR family DNA-binding transcriptional regulator [Candidatus Dependentiae bacterium]|nr:YebC/PmpR family DNA-binding transcriptional regulator [Candidatus Dependentiae bacterium]
MAGHSKWKQIKHKKAKEDSKRGKLFTKLIKEISIAARSGGGDPAGNARLRFLMEKAKEINMPQENTIRAIKRGTGELPGVSYERYMYEGYGPGNSAILIEVLTDNKNRAIAELRTLFSKKGGILAESGAVSWMFDKLGVLEVPTTGLTEDTLLENLLAYPVKDIKEEDDTFSIITDAKALEEVKQGLTSMGIKVENSEIEWLPRETIELGPDLEEKAFEFLGAIEDLDDVQNVYTNLA